MARYQKFTVEEKCRIVEEAHQPGVTVSEVCRRHGVPTSVFYEWEAKIREGGRDALADRRRSREKAAAAEISRLRAELARKNDVIAELTEALMQEKKGLSDYLRRPGSRRR